MELLEITCPRCGAAVRAEYYGPCDTCRDQLRATMGNATTGNEASSIGAAEYEPKMNVTPNAVALKDD